jgi:hypothetical protein
MTDNRRKQDEKAPEASPAEKRAPPAGKKEAPPAEKKSGGMPSAGPHADPRLMNPDATPGSGAIAPIGETDDANSQSTG